MWNYCNVFYNLKWNLYIDYRFPRCLSLTGVKCWQLCTRTLTTPWLTTPMFWSKISPTWKNSPNSCKRRITGEELALWIHVSIKQTSFEFWKISKRKTRKFETNICICFLLLHVFISIISTFYIYYFFLRTVASYIQWLIILPLVKNLDKDTRKLYYTYKKVKFYDPTFRVWFYWICWSYTKFFPQISTNINPKIF